jgi:hypothetical protein
MSKRFFIIPILLLLCQDFVWAQRRAQEDDGEARRQWEEDQRADEYALSLRRRDWLKDRLILELGLGSKFPVMGANWLGLGAGVEYITRWHLSGFFTAGFVPQHSDPVMQGTLDGDVGWRLGFAYYMFEKSPIHLGFQVSYGTVFYDHRVAPEGFDPSDFEPAKFYNESGGLIDLAYPIVMCRGYEFDIFISYLSDQWLYGQIMVGMYYVGEGRRYQSEQDALENDNGSSGWGMTNPSWEYNTNKRKMVSAVTQTDKHPAIPPYGVVFGIGIGFAFEEFFPDDTEIRRREREDVRSGRPTASRSSTVSRSSSTVKKPLKSASKPAPKKSKRVVEDFDEDEEEDEDDE